jgi:single-strand DNA-binding protein
MFKNLLPGNNYKKEREWIKLNKVLLTGRLTRDAELLNYENGVRRAIKFTLAVQRRFKNTKENNDADFIPVVYFTNHADKLISNLTKGKHISVTGNLSVRSVEGEGGSRKYFTDVNADNIEFLERKNLEAFNSFTGDTAVPF